MGKKYIKKLAENPAYKHILNRPVPTPLKNQTISKTQWTSSAGTNILFVSNSSEQSRARCEKLHRVSRNFLKDYDGSAKVALIAIDPSIAAREQMREHFQQRRDDILDAPVP